VRELHDSEAGLLRLLALPHPLRHSGGWRAERLLAPWLAHLAVNADHTPLRTCLLASDDGENGPLCWPAMPAEQAQSLLASVAEAWRAGLDAPLPLACKTTLAYLQYRLRHADDEPEVVEAAAWQAASQTFIGGWNLRGEVDDDPYLARAYPDWPALLAGGERARDWAERLYLPLLHATLSPKECL
jgi:exodeoxyribonuclease V gamma subunit